MEFYRVPIAGGPTALLATVAGTNTAWSGLATTPGGERVIYRTGPVGSSSFTGLYSEPVGGGTKLKLNDQLPSGGTIDYVESSPDGQWDVYISDQRVSDRIEIFSVPSGGGTVAVLNGPMQVNGDVHPQTGRTIWGISRDSTRVVYRARQQ